MDDSACQAEPVGPACQTLATADLPGLIEEVRLGVRPPFSMITADPPWRYTGWNRKDQGAASAAYSLMKLKDICELPISELAAENCALALWGTWPKLTHAMKVIESWGFRYVTGLFVWGKVYEKNGDPYCGLGSYTRSGTEFCLLGIKGRMPRSATNVRQLFFAPVTKHSEKPEEVFDLLDRLWPSEEYPDRLELFSRQPREGWVCWGNQVNAAGGESAAEQAPQGAAN